MGAWHFLEAGMDASWRMIFGELLLLLTGCDVVILLHRTQACVYLYTQAYVYTGIYIHRHLLHTGMCTPVTQAYPFGTTLQAIVYSSSKTGIVFAVFKAAEVRACTWLSGEVCSAVRLMHLWLLHVLARLPSANPFSLPAGMTAELCLVHTAMLWHKGLPAEAAVLLHIF